MNNKKLVSLVAGIVAVVLVLSLILGLLATTASAAPSSSEIKEQIKELEGKNDEMEAQLDALKQQQSSNLTEISAMVNEKSIIEQQVGLLRAQVSNINAQIAAYSTLIADKQEELDASEAYLEELNEKNKERIRAMEEGGSLSYWSVLFGAKSFSDLLDRVNIVDEIAAADQRRLEEMSEAAKLVAEAKEELLVQREALQTTREELAIMKEELDIKSQEAQTLLDQLLAKGDEFEKAMEEYEHALTELEKEIAQAESDYEIAIEKEEAEAIANNNQYIGPGSGSNAGSGGGVGGSTKVDKNGITWVVPCDYRKISSPYGERIHPVYGYKHWHSGVDLDADCLMHDDGTTDSPIYAVRGGVVTIARYNSSAGYYVSIDHGDGYKSTYMHMCCDPFVEVGQVVAAGQIIGCIGTTGTSTGDHLHFGMYYNDSLINPMDYIG